MSVASANPEMLIRYADTAARLNDQLAGRSGALAGALQNFAAACTEYNHGIDDRVAWRLRDYSNHLRSGDERVRQVGLAFARADEGGRWLAVPNFFQSGPPGASEASRWVRDARNWLQQGGWRVAGARTGALNGLPGPLFQLVQYPHLTATVTTLQAVANVMSWLQGKGGQGATGQAVPAWRNRAAADAAAALRGGQQTNSQAWAAMQRDVERVVRVGAGIISVGGWAANSIGNALGWTRKSTSASGATGATAPSSQKGKAGGSKQSGAMMGAQSKSAEGARRSGGIQLELEDFATQMKDGIGWDNCGPASAAMAINFYRKGVGSSITTEKAASAIRNGDPWAKGYTNFTDQEYVDLFNNEDPKLTMQPVSSMHQLESALEDQHPVLIQVHNNEYIDSIRDKYPNVTDPPQSGVIDQHGAFTWSYKIPSLAERSEVVKSDPSKASEWVYVSHIVLVTRYDDQYVYIADPLAATAEKGIDIAIPRDTFGKAVVQPWHARAVIPEAEAGR